MELSHFVWTERGCVEQLTATVAELSPSSKSNDSIDTAVESNCTSCHDAEASSSQVAVVGDSVSKGLCGQSDCTVTQCVQNSEAGAGEVGTVSTEEPPVDVPPAASDRAGSDTTSLLSTSSDSKSVQDITQTSEQTALSSDAHLTLSRKLSSSRERAQTESTLKPSRLQRTASESMQKPCKSLIQTWDSNCYITMSFVRYIRGG